MSTTNLERMVQSQSTKELVDSLDNFKEGNDHPIYYEWERVTKEEIRRREEISKQDVLKIIKQS